MRLHKETVTVTLDVGLHARPAAYFVQEASRFSSEIYVSIGSSRVNAKSIMGVMSLAVAKGTQITIEATGRDEEEAVAILVAIVKGEK
jgi:phosphotransferase system HPr (HPr) family protein